jgi:hypothetical protein
VRPLGAVQITVPSGIVRGYRFPDAVPHALLVATWPYSLRPEGYDLGETDQLLELLTIDGDYLLSALVTFAHIADLQRRLASAVVPNQRTAKDEDSI